MKRQCDELVAVSGSRDAEDPAARASRPPFATTPSVYSPSARARHVKKTTRTTSPARRADRLHGRGGAEAFDGDRRAARARGLQPRARALRVLAAAAERPRRRRRRARRAGGVPGVRGVVGARRLRGVIGRAPWPAAGAPLRRGCPPGGASHVDAAVGDGAVRRAPDDGDGVAPAHAQGVPGRGGGDRRRRGRRADGRVGVGRARGLARPGAVRALGHRLQDEPGRRRRGGRLPGPRRRGQGRGAGDRAQGARHRHRARGEPCRAGAVAVVRGRRAGVRRRPGRSRGEARRVLRMRGVLLPVQGTP